MKHNLLLVSLLISGANVSFADAQPPLETRWDHVCDAVDGREITVNTAAGDTVRGYCVSVQVDQMQIRTTDQKVVKLARTALSKIQVDQNRSQLKALGRGMKHSLREGVKMTFSPFAPIGLVMVPTTLAWGAVAAPFCILGDIGHGGAREVKLIP